MARISYDQLEFEGEICRFQGPPFTGIAVEEDEDGRVVSEAQYRHGIKDGTTRVWYNNGQLKYEANYKMGAANGLRKEWYEDGKLKAERLREVGISVREREWDRNGNLTREYDIDPAGDQYRLLERWRADEDARIRKLLAYLGVSDPQVS